MEGAPDAVVAQPGPDGGEQQRRAGWCREQPVADLQVGVQRRHGGGMQRQQPGLAEFAVTHLEQPVVVGVEVVAVQADRLADAHPGDGQQSDQGLVGRRSQRTGQPGGGSDERGDVGWCIQVGDALAWPAPDQRGWHEFDTRVAGVQVGGEPARHRQPVHPPARIRVGGQGCPGQRILDGGGPDVVVVEVGDVLGQQVLGPLQLEAQRPPDAQVVGQRLAQRQRAHAAPGVVGQGRASRRSASMSTLA